MPKSVVSVTIGRIQSDLRFQRPARQRPAIATPRPIAVNEITPQIPALPQRFAAQPARGIRDAVSAVDVNIGGTVSPAPPSAPSKTISAHTFKAGIYADRLWAYNQTQAGAFNGSFDFGLQVRRRPRDEADQYFASTFAVLRDTPQRVRRAASAVYFRAHAPGGR